MKSEKDIIREQQAKNDLLIDLVRQNCKGMSDQQVNLYLVHLKNKMKMEEEKNGSK